MMRKYHVLTHILSRTISRYQPIGWGTRVSPSGPLLFCALLSYSTLQAADSPTATAASETPSVTSAAANQPLPTWGPSAPVPLGEKLDMDWLRLANGEWIKGEIIAMRNDTIEFDSDEFGVQSLDWEDVAELHSANPVTLSRLDMTTQTGRISLVGDEIIFHDSGAREAKNAYLSIVPEEKSWWSLWNGDVGFGFTARRGNTRQTDVSVSFSAVHRTAYNRLRTDANYLQSESNDEEIENNTRIFAGWDRYVSRRWFLTPLQYEFFQDRFQNIRQRHSPGLGAGYSIIDRSGFEWDVDGGIGYQYTEFYSVAPGESTTNETGVVLLGTRMSGDITDTTDFELAYSIIQGLDLGENTQHTFDASLGVDITGDLELEVSFHLDYNGDPQADSDGNIPTKTDYRFAVGLSYEF